MRRNEFEDRILAMLLGGAVGDALAAPLEFLSLAEIRARYGPLGPSTYVESPDGRGRFTDDTQMTLFTAEGLIRAHTRAAVKGASHRRDVVHHAYLRWLHTQGDHVRARPEGCVSWPDGWLAREPAMQAVRAPGATCMGALRSAAVVGDPAAGRNQSKGCGGVMRVAPVAVLDPDEAFEVGCEVAALTHGHPTGWLAAGALAEILSHALRGMPVESAAVAVVARLRSRSDSEETIRAIRAGLEAAGRARPSAETTEALGGGWTADEALAIGLYAATAAPDVLTGLRLAAFHSGDSDSTAAIAGQILGASRGRAALPEALVEALDPSERGIVETLAHDLHAHLVLEEDGIAEGDWARYPGW